MGYRDKAKQRGAYRRWLANHREEHAQKCKEWRENNPDKQSSYMRGYFLEHHEEEPFKEMHRKSNRKWRGKRKLSVETPGQVVPVIQATQPTN